MVELETSKLVEALLRPEAYPHRPERVELAQTQMSLVFMTGQFVYKVKKPVNLGYLDYSTLAKRLFFCQQEVALNRRLCPEVYLGVAPIARQGDRLVVEGKGEAVEYAVKMRQLPRDRTMDVLLEKGRVTREMVRQVADRMARFHSQAETSPAISAFGSLEAIHTNTQENFSQTERYVGRAISSEQYGAIRDWTRAFMKRQAPLFERRVREGRIRDCHGDLHAAHVCFSKIPRYIGGTDGICIYDCIEFNNRFRYCDVASEIAFLAMDLDFHRHPDLSRTFTRSYMELAGDKDMGQLLDFYKVYRAYVRGKVECFRSEDRLVSPADREKALHRAQAYFDLAVSYIEGGPRRPRRTTLLSPRGRERERVPIHRDPVKGDGGHKTPSERRNRQSRKSTTPLRLFITVGMVGTGKTALAEALARELDVTVLSSDAVRKGLAAIPLTEHRYEEFNAGIYSADFTRRTYDALFDEADRLLSEGKSVILDASFKRAEERDRARQAARMRGADFWLIEVTCPEEVVRQRLEERLRQPNVPSDGRWEIYLAQKRDFDPVQPEAHHIRADSSKSLAQMVEDILSRLSGQHKASASRRGR